jgi:hypothetical protein
MVKVTFVVKGKSQTYLDWLASLSHPARFNVLNELHRDKAGVTMQYGNKNDVATGVELNRLVKIDNQTYTYSFESRKGYKLATFYIG